MENFRKDGVYVKSKVTPKEGLSRLFASESERVSYGYYLFYKNADSEFVNIYHYEATGGDFISWMKSFAQWSELGKELHKIKSYKVINEDEITYVSSNGVEISLWLDGNGDRLILNSTYLKSKNLSHLEYIFFPFPPYYELKC